MDATRPPPGTTMDEMTPLHVAAYVGTYKLLFEAIAANEEGLNEGDLRGRKPLHYAALGHTAAHVECMQDLVDAGADVNAADENGDTPLHLAAMRGNLDACSYLVHEAGADLQLRNRDSDTPFDVATRCGHHRVALLVRWKDMQALARSTIRRCKLRSLRQFLGGVCVYLVFLAAFTWLVMSSFVTSTPFYMLSAVRTGLQEENVEFEGGGVHLSWDDIATTTDLWKVLEGPVWEFVDNEAVVDGRLPAPHAGVAQGHLYFAGPLRLRQVRMRNDTCSVRVPAGEGLPCFAERFSEGVESRAPHAGVEWQSAAQLGGSSTGTWGRVLGQWYPDSGFVVTLPTNSTEALPILSRLRAERWVDVSTSAVMLEFTLYSPPSDTWLSGQLLAELPSVGGVIPSDDIRAIALHHRPRVDPLLLGAEVTTAVITVAFVIYEVRDVCKQWRKRPRRRARRDGERTVPEEEEDPESLSSPGGSSDKVTLLGRAQGLAGSARGRALGVNGGGDGAQRSTDVPATRVNLRARWKRAGTTSVPMGGGVGGLDGGSGKPFTYHTRLWTWIKVADLALLVACAALRLRNITTASALDLRVERSDFLNLRPLSDTMDFERNLFGLLALAFWVQLLRYVQYIPIVGPLARVLAKVLPDVAAFAVLFIIYLAGAAIAFSLTFGREMAEFSTVWVTLVSLFRGTFGDLDYDRMAEVNRVLAPVLAVLHLAIGGVLVINLLIALLNTRYEASHKEATQEWRNDVAGVKGGAAEQEDDEVAAAVRSALADNNETLLASIKQYDLEQSQKRQQHEKMMLDMLARLRR